MRRCVQAVAVVAVAALAGCDKMKDAFSARPEVAAEAGKRQLPVDRLATLMASIKGVPMSRDAADFIANMWVDHALFAEALASGHDMADSATAAQVLWPELSELIGSRWHDALVANRTPATPEVADSVYQADGVRLLQHILIRIEPNAEPPARAAARRKAEQVLARVQKGEDFARLARQVSEDPGSKSEGGYYPPAPRGKYVTAFDSAGWSLAPGGRTGLVETPFGYHIIRRPPAEEVRDRMLSFARDQLGAVLDSIYLDSLGAERGLKVEGGAPGAMRKALTDKARALTSTDRLATYQGGSFTVAEFMQWVNALGPAWSTNLSGQPDSALVRFARLIGQNKLLLQQADSAGVRPSPEEWASMLQRYQGMLDTLRLTLDLSGSDLTDAATPEPDRQRIASMKIDSYWDRIASGASRPRPIPGPLAGLLRVGGSYEVNQAGLLRAVEVAKEKRAHADSAGTGNPIQPPRPPAPGGG